MADSIFDEAKQRLADILRDKKRESSLPWRKNWQFTYQHSLRVEKIALKLLAAEGNLLSEDEVTVLRLAAILHDIGRLEETSDHARLGAELTLQWMDSRPEIARQVKNPALLIDLIREHSNKDQPESDLRRALIKDADLLDEIGAFSILMMADRVDRSSPYFFYELRDQLQQKDIPFCMEQAKRLQTQAGMQYLEQKIGFIQAFVDQLEQELEGVERSDPFL